LTVGASGVTITTHAAPTISNPGTCTYAADQRTGDAVYSLPHLTPSHARRQQMTSTCFVYVKRSSARYLLEGTKKV